MFFSAYTFEVAASGSLSGTPFPLGCERDFEAGEATRDARIDRTFECLHQKERRARSIHFKGEFRHAHHTK